MACRNPWCIFDETFAQPGVIGSADHLQSGNDKPAQSRRISVLDVRDRTDPREGWREMPIHGLGLVVGFYSSFILCLIAMIVVFGAASKLGPKINWALLGLSCIVLFGFGLFQLWKGLFG